MFAGDGLFALHVFVLETGCLLVYFGLPFFSNVDGERLFDNVSRATLWTKEFCLPTSSARYTSVYHFVSMTLA
jgi:hypothetical protein